MKLKALIIALLAVISVTAQPPHHENCPHRKKIEAEKIAYLTTELDLTPQEAQQFWPIYNEFEKKKDELINERKNIISNIQSGFETVSDKDAEKMSDRLIEIDIAESKLRQEYHQKYKKVLPIKKVIKFYHLERKFKQQLLRKIRGKGPRYHGGH